MEDVPASCCQSMLGRARPQSVRGRQRGSAPDRAMTLRRIMKLSAAVLASLCLLVGDGRAAGEEEFLAGRAKSCPDCALARAKLKRRDLANADLSGANLAEAVLHRTRLGRANLTAANLTAANLNKADLKNASLRNARLEGTMLYEADASSADF